MQTGTPASNPVMNISAEALAAIEELRQLPGNFRVTNFGGHWRLQRSDGTSWYVWHVSADHWSAFNAACLKGLRMAKAMLADERKQQLHYELLANRAEASKRYQAEAEHRTATVIWSSPEGT